MKHTIILIGLLIPSLAFAQNHSIGWYKIAGGGGSSTSGPMIGINYSVSGTIGQPDASGAILGKAMTGLSEGKGMVLVLVTLQ